MRVVRQKDEMTKKELVELLEMLGYFDLESILIMPSRGREGWRNMVDKLATALLSRVVIIKR